MPPILGRYIYSSPMVSCDLFLLNQSSWSIKFVQSTLSVRQKHIDTGLAYGKDEIATVLVVGTLKPANQGVEPTNMNMLQEPLKGQRPLYGMVLTCIDHAASSEIVVINNPSSRKVAVSRIRRQMWQDIYRLPVLTENADEEEAEDEAWPEPSDVWVVRQD